MFIKINFIIIRIRLNFEFFLPSKLLLILHYNLLFVVGTYWIFTIIITTAYTSSIIAFITLPAQPVIVDSSYQLVDQRYRVMTLGR